MCDTVYYYTSSIYMVLPAVTVVFSTNSLAMSNEVKGHAKSQMFHFWFQMELLLPMHDEDSLSNPLFYQYNLIQNFGCNSQDTCDT